MKIIKTALTALLAMLFVFTSGCGSGARWAFTYNGESIPAGAYINYMIFALMELEENEVNANSDNADYVFPTTKELLKQSTDGKLNADWIREEAVLMAAEHFAIDRLFAELGLELTESEITALNSYADYVIAYNPDFYAENGISRSTVLMLQTDEYKKEKIYNAIYGPGGEKEISEDELKALMKEKYLKVAVMFLMLEDTNAAGVTVENRENAEAYLERFKAGEKLPDLIYEYMLSRAGTQEEKDAVEKQDESDSIWILDKNDTNITAYQSLEAFALAAEGEYGVCSDENYYYVFKRLNVLEDPADFEEYREGLLTSARADEFDEYLRTLAAEISLEANQAALSRYTPEKIKTDMLS